MNSRQHLTAETIERYGAKKSSPAEFLAASDHLAACAECRQKLEFAVSAQAAFAGLQSQFAALSDEDFTHLPYEQLALYVDGKMDSVEREIADSHLAVCENCREDLADLRGFQMIATASAQNALAQTPNRQTISAEAEKSSSWWQRLFAFDFFSGANFLAPAGVGLAVLALLFVGVWLATRPNAENQIVKIQPSPQNQNSSPNITNSLSVNQNSAEETNSSTNQESPDNSSEPLKPSKDLSGEGMLFALNDNGKPIGFDSEGNLSGAENLPAAVRDSVERTLKTQKVPVSPAVSALRNNQSGVLMGEANERAGVPFALQNPVGKVVRETQPVLRWKPLADAKFYKVAVVDANFRVVAQSENLNSTSWKINKPLVRGANYSWQVTAVKADGSETISPSSPAPQARFRVIEQSALNAVEQVEKSGVKSHLARGIAYAQAGLIEEARAEFQALLKENPRSSLARKLLQSLR